jgi:hypothetical protein
MATFGMGKLASGALKGVAEGTEELGKTTVAAERGAMMAKGEAFLARSGDLFGDSAKAKIMAEYEANVIPKYAPELAKFDGKLPLLTRFALKIGGTSEDVGSVRTLLGAYLRFTGNSTFVDNLKAGRYLTAALGINAGTTFTAGIGAPLLGGLEIDGPSGDPVHIGSVPLGVHLPENPLSKAFDKAEDGTTIDGGFTTAQIDELARLVSGAPSIPSFSLSSGSW